MKMGVPTLIKLSLDGGYICFSLMLLNMIIPLDPLDNRSPSKNDMHENIHLSYRI